MARRLIGSGTTDSNGRISVPYTGKGAGKIQLVAVSGTLQSEIYSVWDYIKYDKGTINDHKDIWTVSRGKLERMEEYTSISQGTDTHYLAKIPFSKGQVVEFDYNLIDIGTGQLYNWQIYFMNSGTTVFADSLYLFTQTPQLNTWYHVKIEVTDVISIYPQYRETPIIDSSKDTSLINEFAFYNPNGIKEVAFKNFKVYPI